MKSTNIKISPLELCVLMIAGMMIACIVIALIYEKKNVSRLGDIPNNNVIHTLFDIQDLPTDLSTEWSAPIIELFDTSDISNNLPKINIRIIDDQDQMYIRQIVSENTFNQTLKQIDGTLAPNIPITEDQRMMEMSIERSSKDTDLPYDDYPMSDKKCNQYID